LGRRTYRLILAYDGTRYRGWQRLPGVKNTIQGRIEEILSRIFAQPIEIHGSGRTDAGVHAAAQVVSFTAPERQPERILAQLRHYLPEDIGAISLEYAADRFHARLSAREKTYCYRIHNSELPDVFGNRFRVQLSGRLDLAAMKLAAKKLLGTHDFSAFCANKHMKKSTVRTLKRLEIQKNGTDLTFTLTADGFLYHMVRILVGTLLEIGKGSRSVDTIEELLQGGKREQAGETAPAKGLCLMEVVYE